MNGHDELIASLSSNLRSVKPAVNIDRMAIGWLLACSSYVIVITHLMGPIRPNAFAQLMTESRYLIEVLCGALAITIGTLIAFRSSVPGALQPRFALFGGLLLWLWLSFYVFGLVSPALEPSMLGKREYCVWETLVFAFPPMLAGYLLSRRFYPLQPVRTAMAISLMAGMLPALYMQIACMYEPAHILKFHILPGFVVMLIGAGVALLIRAAR